MSHFVSFAAYFASYVRRVLRRLFESVLVMIAWLHASSLLVLHVSTSIRFTVVLGRSSKGCKDHIWLKRTFTIDMTVWWLHFVVRFDRMQIVYCSLVVCLCAWLANMLVLVLCWNILLFLRSSLHFSIVSDGSFETRNIVVRHVVLIVVIHQYLFCLVWNWRKIGHWVPARGLFAR